MIFQTGKGQRIQTLVQKGSSAATGNVVTGANLCLGSRRSIHADSSIVEIDTHHCREQYITKRRQWQR